MSKVERKRMVNEIKEEERSMVNEIKNKSKIHKEAIMSEINDSKAREETKIIRQEEAMINDEWDWQFKSLWKNYDEWDQEEDECHWG